MNTNLTYNTNTHDKHTPYGMSRSSTELLYPSQGQQLWASVSLSNMFDFFKLATYAEDFSVDNESWV